ncbi:transposase [Streptomyces sp. NPDC002838]|uniref:transposase n=1 Tax=Streptomyces sp. NPDC002838 TaxID=3154436 RepID=UPI003326FD88
MRQHDQRACSGLFRRPMQLPRCPLSLRPCSGEQVPSLTVQIARASNPMATVCVLQFLLGLSDRQAAEAVRCRIDFKYALALELDDPGFHHSVLAGFRERLTQDDRADRLLDLALARLKEAGLVRERTIQRTDSTHVLAAVRDLTRLELVTEAVRAVLEEVARTADHLLIGLVDADWGRRYGRPVRLGKNPTRPKTRILAAGDDAWRLLERLHRQGPGYRPGPQAEALRQIMVQNYYRDAAGRLHWRTPDDGGLAPSSSAILSPYDTTARYLGRSPDPLILVHSRDNRAAVLHASRC